MLSMAPFVINAVSPLLYIAMLLLIRYNHRALHTRTLPSISLHRWDAL